MLYRFRNSGPRFDLRKPVEVDKEYKAEIEEISRRGDGIAKIEGFVIFVPNVGPGDFIYSRLSVGLPIRQAWRHHMVIQKKSGRMAKKERIPKDLI